MRGLKVLERYDEVMVNAFDRYQKESGDKTKAAWKLKGEEKEFAKYLALLSDLGYGVGDEGVKGCNLFANTREAMRKFIEDVSEVFLRLERNFGGLISVYSLFSVH